MKRVILDGDGVFIDFVSAILDDIETRTGTRHAFEAITEFDIGKALGVSFDDWTWGIRPGWCRALKPLPGAIDGVKRIMEIADVWVVTSPWAACPTWGNEREAWCMEHLGLPRKKIMNGAGKEICTADVFVDDRLSTVIEWHAANPDGLAVVWDAPWNQGELPEGVLRTSNWDTLYTIIENAQPRHEVRRSANIALIEAVLLTVAAQSGRSFAEFGNSRDLAEQLLEEVEGGH